MGSVAQGGNDDDRGAFFPFTAALYDEPAFDPLGLELADADELVPLVELVSSDDAVLAYTLDSDSESLALHRADVVSPPPHSHSHEQLESAAAGSSGDDTSPAKFAVLAPALPPSSSRTVTKKQRSGGGATARKSVKHNPNRARDERKGELIYLRKKVDELEQQLCSIQAKRPRITTVSAVSSDTAAVAGGSCLQCVSSMGGAQQQPKLEQQQQQTLSQLQCAHTQAPIVVNVWQDIASRQSEERVKAERENIRLRLVLENQLKIAKSLEKVLNKKTTTKDIEEFVERNHMCAPGTVDASDEAIFNALLKGVQKSYAHIDAVFEANGLAHTETPLSNARVRSDAGNGMLLELFANKILPFDMVATGDAVWHHFAFAKEHTPFRCYSYSSSKYLHSSEDTIVENFILKLDAKGTVGNFRVKQILRRHIEEHRTVVVWRASIEAFEFSDEPISGIRFCESGFIVIKKPRTLAGNHTLLQTCYIFTPNFTEEVAGSDHPRVGALTDFVLASTASNISSTHQMIENVLLEQALKNSGRVQSVS